VAKTLPNAQLPVVGSMTERKKFTDLSPSICEIALNSYSQSDDSLAELVRAHDINVREFMVLSFVCDQGHLSKRQISAILGMVDGRVTRCIDKLMSAGLLEIHREAGDGGAQYRSSTNGEELASRIHERATRE